MLQAVEDWHLPVSPTLPSTHLISSVWSARIHKVACTKLTAATPLPYLTPQPTPSTVRVILLVHDDTYHTQPMIEQAKGSKKLAETRCTPVRCRSWKQSMFQQVRLEKALMVPGVQQLTSYSGRA